MFLLTEYWPRFKSFTLINVFVTNLDTVESFNNLDILYRSMLYDTFLNLFNISSFFSSEIIISSKIIGFSSAFIILSSFDLATASEILVTKNSPALWTTFCYYYLLTINIKLTLSLVSNGPPFKCYHLPCNVTFTI